MADSENALLTVSNSRLYGGVVAIVAGLYSVVLAMVLTSAAPVATAGWGLLVLGLVVIAHGFLLLTPFVERALGNASGPLMAIYGVLLLALQGWLTWTGEGFAVGEAAQEVGALAASGWAAGVVALSVLLLASGAILTARRDRVYAVA